MENIGRTLVCYACGKTYNELLTEGHDPEKEYLEKFGSYIANTPDEAVDVCETCYNKIAPGITEEDIQYVRDAIMKRANN